MTFKASEASCDTFSEYQKLLLVAFLEKKKNQTNNKTKHQKVFFVVEKPGTASFLKSFYLILSADQERRNLAINTPTKRNK